MSTPCQKQFSIGIDDFREVIKNNFYYIDKSLLIKDLLDNYSKVALLLRPRRFGKTLNLSMLKYYFDINQTAENLFENLEIWQAGERYRQEFAKYPVIFISLKELKAKTWEEAFSGIKFLFAKLYNEFDYLLSDDFLSQSEKERFNTILTQQGEWASYTQAMSDLCLYLNNYHQQKVILLIDEYDTPIHQALEHGYISDMLSFMGPFLGSALKGNLSLHFGVITGILKVSKENLFSDLNNINVFTTFQFLYSQRFGLLENEVQQLLQDYNIPTSINEIRKWYDGYSFGDHENIYNPWSILKYAQAHAEGFQPYWVNTGGTMVIEKALAGTDYTTKMQLEQLLNDEELIVEINDNIMLDGSLFSANSIWAVLLASGYLTTSVKAILKRPDFPVKIPNQEVKEAFRNIIKRWFEKSVNQNYLRNLTMPLISGDIKTFGRIFQNYVKSTLSYFDVGGDEPEKFYHALVLGMLVHLKETHQVKSNRESGFGRYDVMLIPNDKNQLGIIIEFKKMDEQDEKNLEISAQNALQQIEDNHYAQELQDLGIKNIISLAIVFKGKEALIKELKPRNN